MVRTSVVASARRLLPRALAAVVVPVAWVIALPAAPASAAPLDPVADPPASATAAPVGAPSPPEGSDGPAVPGPPVATAAPPAPSGPASGPDSQAPDAVGSGTVGSAAASEGTEQSPGSTPSDSGSPTAAPTSPPASQAPVAPSSAAPTATDVDRPPAGSGASQAPTPPVAAVPDQPPVFTSARRAVLAEGQPGSFTVRTTGSPVPAIQATDVPLGLSLVDHGDGTATLAGTPAFDGHGVISLTATSAAGTATQRLAIEARSIPTFTSGDTALFEQGAPGSFDITTTGVPAPRITADEGDLPAGLRLVDNGDGTATILGTPTAAAGTFSVDVTATSAAGTTDLMLSVVVQNPPGFTSTSNVRFAAGAGGTFTVTTSGVPKPTIVVDGELPGWLAFDDFGDGTGTLRTVGPAPAGATAVLELRAMNAIGADAVQTVRVSVG
ncbi:hypothetical protein [Microlunatus ginsengisoli]